MFVTGSGFVTENDLDKELEILFSGNNINKSSANIKIEEIITN